MQKSDLILYQDSCYNQKKQRMSIFRKNNNYYRERIRLGSISIKPEDLAFSTFLMGYYIAKVNIGIDQLFQLFDIIEELIAQKMISSLLKIQLLTLLEEFPKDIGDMIIVLSDYKNGKNIDVIRWIESFYSHQQQPINNYNEVHQSGIPVEEILEPNNKESLIQVEDFHIKKEQRKINSDQDIELARKIQQQFDNQKESEQVLCEICYCGLYDNAFDYLDACGHFFHVNCMSQSFKTNIFCNNFPVICPQEGCKQEVTEGDLKRILDNGLLEKYHNHTLKAYAECHGDSISWCPTANCSYMFFYEKGDRERFQCLECKKQYCLNCRSQWHQGMTCKQYKVSMTISEQDQKFLEFAKGKKFKQCPKCKFWVEKNKGCDHMTCKCKFQFCYKCGGVYTKCECMQNKRKQHQRRMAKLQQRRIKKEERKKKQAEKAAEKAVKRQQKQRQKESHRRQRQRSGRNNTSSSRSRSRKRQ